MVNRLGPIHLSLEDVTLVVGHGVLEADDYRVLSVADPKRILGLQLRPRPCRNVD
jgi:hypothetical protein